MQKKGQVTVFIIISIVVLGLVVAIYSLLDFQNDKNLQESEQKMQTLEDESNVAALFFKDCSTKTIERAIRTVALRAGAKSLQEDHFSYKNIKSNYLTPTSSQIEEVEGQIRILLHEKIGDCLPESKTRVEYLRKPTKILVQIEPDTILTRIEYPLVLSLEGVQKEVDLQVEHLLNARLGKIINLSSQIYEQTTRDPYFIDPLFLLGHNFTIDITPYQNDTLIYLIQDESARVDTLPLQYLFALNVSEVQHE